MDIVRSHLASNIHIGRASLSNAAWRKNLQFADPNERLENLTQSVTNNR